MWNLPERQPDLPAPGFSGTESDLYAKLRQGFADRSFSAGKV